MTHLTISIPVYNDAYTIAKVVGESISVLSGVTDNFKILIINDGSEDGTSKILDQLSKEDSRIKLHEHKKNLGFGPTIKEVYTLPESEWVFFVPGDGQIAPSEILKLIPYIPQYNFILGHRKKRNDPWHRKFNSWCYNWIVSLLARRRVHDVNSAALLKRALIKDIPFHSQSAFIHAEILLKALQNGASFIEIEIEHKLRKHGKGSGNKWKVISSTIEDLVRYLMGRL